MPSLFLHVGIWPRLTALARRHRGYVAVAYCNAGARRLLPLRSGSVLVVDASPHALKSGQTNPEELEKFVRAGVEVHNASGLHAKVFVFGRVAVIGSSNVSRRSANYLQEAALLSREHAVVSDARDFVLSQTGERLTLQHLRKLREIYRPPRFVPGGPLPRRSSRSKLPIQSPLWLVPLEYVSWDEHDHEQADKARPLARKQLRKDQKLDEFSLRGADTRKLKAGEQVIQVMTDGRRTLAYPAGHIVKIQKDFGARRVPSEIVFLTIPERVRPKPIAQVTKFLGSDRKVLTRLMSPRRIRVNAVAHKLRQIWRPR